MAINSDTTAGILSAARAQIGKKTYKDIDCSHFVHASYAAAGLHYPYTSTAAFDKLTSQGQDFFEKVGGDSKQAGDVLLYAGHMGIWDSEGCQVLRAEGAPNDQCTKLKDDAPVLSSRSGGNRGPDFGQSKWFGSVKACYRWKGLGKPDETGKKL